MIGDAIAKNEIGRQWANVIRLQGAWPPAGVVGGGQNVFLSQHVAEGYFGLPLVLAYSAFGEVLSAMMSEGVFNCKRRGRRSFAWNTKYLSIQIGAGATRDCFNLHEMMKAARRQIAFDYYHQIEKGRILRNEFAHDGKVVDEILVGEAISAIGFQLKDWHIF